MSTIPEKYYLDPDGDLITRKPINTIQIHEIERFCRKPSFTVTVYWENGKKANYYRETRGEAEALRALLIHDLIVAPARDGFADLTARLETEIELRKAAEANLQSLTRIAAGEESAVVSGAAVTVRDEILRLRDYLRRATDIGISATPGTCEGLERAIARLKSDCNELRYNAGLCRQAGQTQDVEACEKTISSIEIALRILEPCLPHEP